MLRKITVTRRTFLCVEFVYPRSLETIIAFIDLWAWNLFPIHLMMAIGLYNATRSCPWESLLAAGVEACENVDKQVIIDCNGEFINAVIRGKHVRMNRNDNQRIITSKNQIRYIQLCTTPPQDNVFKSLSQNSEYPL
jgi:hypothetical protein